MVAALLAVGLVTGCGAPAPAITPTPSGPRTLVDLIAAAPESPVVTLDESTRAQDTGFSTVLASYPSEGLTITGLLYLPDGDGPFPFWPSSCSWSTRPPPCSVPSRLRHQPAPP